MNRPVIRGKFISACGGGKTRVIYDAGVQSYNRGAKLQVLLAPTINLLLQHHETFRKNGMFIDGSVAPIHFRTGSEARGSTDIKDYTQTTCPEQFTEALETDKNVFVFCTYASERKMFDIIRELGIEYDVVYADEFHNLVKQDTEHKEHLRTLPTKNFFSFSASEKPGRIVSSFDETLFGPTMANISYRYLVEQGILVPKVSLGFVRLTDGAQTKVEHSLVEQAEIQGFDLRKASLEGAGLVAAFTHLKSREPTANLLNFTQQVAISRAIVDSKTVRGFIPADTKLNVVSASTTSYDRDRIFEEVKTSSMSILTQYGILKEGIDVTAFNGLLLSRVMCLIGFQQGLGRVVRAHPDDTTNLKAEKISLDSPVGWKKYTAHLYILVDDESEARFPEFVRQVLGLLQDAGLTKEDWGFDDLVDAQNGVEPDGMDWLLKPEIPVGDVLHTVGSILENIVIEMEDEERDEYLRRLSKQQLFKLYLKGDKRALSILDEKHAETRVPAVPTAEVTVPA